MTMIARGAGEIDEVAAIALWRCCGLLVGHNDPAVDFRFARGRENSDVLLGFGTDGRVIASAMVGMMGTALRSASACTSATVRSSG
jgi:hypothetical protein